MLLRKSISNSILKNDESDQQLSNPIINLKSLSDYENFKKLYKKTVIWVYSSFTYTPNDAQELFLNLVKNHENLNFAIFDTAELSYKELNHRDKKLKDYADDCFIYFYNGKFLYAIGCAKNKMGGPEMRYKLGRLSDMATEEITSDRLGFNQFGSFSYGQQFFI